MSADLKCCSWLITALYTYTGWHSREHRSPVFCKLAETMTEQYKSVTTITTAIHQYCCFMFVAWPRELIIQKTSDWDEYSQRLSFALQSDVESNTFSSMTHKIHSGRRLKLGVTPSLSDKAGDWEFGPHKMDTHFQNALSPCCGLHVTLTVVHKTPV